MNQRQIDWSIYVVTDRHLAGARSVVDVVRMAIQGGASVIQLRDKNATTRDMISLGQALHEITRAANVPLIVNDRVDVALAIDAEGVHVGPDDMEASTVRQIIGPDRILGLSTKTIAQARAAAAQGADYIGVGPVYSTLSKADAGAPIGVAGLAEIARASALPAVGIGGITVENALAVIEAGAVGVAIISAIVSAADPAAAVRRLREQLAPQARRI